MSVMFVINKIICHLINWLDSDLSKFCKFSYLIGRVFQMKSGCNLETDLSYYQLIITFAKNELYIIV